MGRARRKKRRASRSEETARIKVVFPAVEAGLQRGTLVNTEFRNEFTRPGRRGDRSGLQPKISCVLDLQSALA